ncbi:MAG: glycosyltransferase family 2 protein [Candidatus Lindowbacteria bacterium]|nr:glycosyltransferase family 2 protein [Candidatus Lindowbacteria bacterium]
MPKVSIIIRSFNDIGYIGRVFDMIKTQTFTNYEIISVDSGSTDGTYEEIKRRHPAVHYQIRPDEYVPGKVLNTAVAKGTGDIIVFNNSDCIPQNNRWLENLINPILHDERIAAVFCRQAPRPNASNLVRFDHARAFGDGSISSKWHHFFSLASSAIPKRYLEMWPFRSDLKYSEDIEWSFRMRGRGYKIEYRKDAVVEHSHNYTAQELFRRFRGEGGADAKIFGDGSKKKFFSYVLRPYLGSIARDLGCLTAKGLPNIWLIESLKNRYIQNYARYVGYNEEVEESGL